MFDKHFIFHNKNSASVKARGKISFFAKQQAKKNHLIKGDIKENEKDIF